MKNNIKKIVKTVIIIAIIILVILCYYYIFKKNKAIQEFSNQIVANFNDNKNSNFRINQILMYSSATAKDNSQDSSLKNLSISQYTDIAIYIDNKSKQQDLTERNTVNKLYIDNIKLETPDKNASLKLNYKSPKLFGKYSDIDTLDSDKIDFNIIHSNSEVVNDNNTPKYFTDCTNPITLEFVNADILKNFEVSEENKRVSFNGSILKDANINLKNITPKLSMDIHIINNMNEEYFCRLYLDIVLENSDGNIKDGYIIILNNYGKNDFNFIKVNK